MKWWNWLWPATITASAAAIGLIVYGNAQTPLRPLLALWFLLVCPGMAFVGLLRLHDRLVELTLAIALSLALDALVAGAMLYTGAWSPEGSLAILIGLSAVGALLQLAVPRDALLREWRRV